MNACDPFGTPKQIFSQYKEKNVRGKKKIQNNHSQSWETYVTRGVGMWETWKVEKKKVGPQYEFSFFLLTVLPCNMCILSLAVAILNFSVPTWFFFLFSLNMDIPKDSLHSTYTFVLSYYCFLFYTYIRRVS